MRPSKSTWKATPMHSPCSLKAGPPLFPEQKIRITKISSLFPGILVRSKQDRSMLWTHHIASNRIPGELFVFAKCRYKRQTRIYGCINLNAKKIWCPMCIWSDLGYSEWYSVSITIRLNTYQIKWSENIFQNCFTVWMCLNKYQWSICCMFQHTSTMQKNEIIWESVTFLFYFTNQIRNYLSTEVTASQH